jgi:uncharacterized membrane protein
MGGMGAIHLTIVAVVLMLFAVPTALILKRMGYSPFLTLLLLIPGMPIFGLWFLALARWPVLAARDTEEV